MKTAIIYESTHHGNTKKLLDAIAQKHEVVLIDVTGTENISLEEYDVIGFASGVAFGKFYKKITEVAETKLPAGKKVFFIYSCGNNSKDFSKNIREIAERKNCVSLGTYGCKGYDTYGPFGLIGGINKNHPDEQEIADAVKFYEELKA